MDYTKIINDIFMFYKGTGVNIGILGIFIFVILLGVLYRFYPKSKFGIFFEMTFEKIFDFFEEILGQEEKKSVKVFVTSLFFVIMLSNLFGVFLDMLLPIFEVNFGEGVLEKLIISPTANMEFTVGLAILTVGYILLEQIKYLGFFKFLHEYVPIFGKGYIPYTRGNLKPIFDIPVFLLVKFFDIFISLFLGILDIIGVLAKVISLSFRLFGNVTSGTVLLMMMVGGLTTLTNMISTEFNFPIIFPLIVYLQGILVALIQAFVFSLLTAIFIKSSRV